MGKVVEVELIACQFSRDPLDWNPWSHHHYTTDQVVWREPIPAYERGEIEYFIPCEPESPATIQDAVSL